MPRSEARRKGPAAAAVRQVFNLALQVYGIEGLADLLAPALGKRPSDRELYHWRSDRVPGADAFVALIAAIGWMEIPKLISSMDDVMKEARLERSAQAASLSSRVAQLEEELAEQPPEPQSPEEPPGRATSA